MRIETNALARDLAEAVDAIGSSWEDLRGARIFLTGGTGFFGCWLLETLLWANDHLGLDATAVVLTRNPERFSGKAPHLAAAEAVTLHHGNITSFRFPDGAATHVIHAALETSSAAGRSERLREFDSTVTGTRRILDFARAAGVRRFLFVSSGSVYGPQPKDISRIPERYDGAPDVTVPMSAGAEAKRAAELLCTLYADGRLTTTTARCFTFVGPYLELDNKFAIGNFIRDGLRGGPIRVLGDGSQVRSYMYGAELAVWLWTILIRGAAGRAYNVGSEEPVSIGDAAHAVAQRFAPAPAVSIVGMSVPGQAPSQYVPDTSRARSELGLRSNIDLGEALTRTVRWHAVRSGSTHDVQ
ncbi:MAG TPA: NAD(P)-dependent oxidoreductase [Vicinamibacterales bacterium]|nr:NAD(P)-dependent oxidoreductase [Vicinamibacterales bacterium]